MLKIKCPNCKCEFEVENTVAGCKVACECGMIHQLPLAPPAGDFRICVNCARLCEKDAAICPDCSFNFLSGKIFDCREENFAGEEMEPFWKRKLSFLIKTGLFLFLAAVVFLIWNKATSSKIGVSASAPLGIMTDSGKYNQLTFESFKSVLSKDFPALTFWRYQPSGHAFPGENILLAVDETGRVQAVIGSFSVPEKIIAMGGTAGENFFKRLQKEFGIPAELSYKSVRHGGSGRMGFTEQVGEYETAAFQFRHGRIEHGSGLTSSSQNFHISTGEIPSDKLNHIQLPEGTPVFDFSTEDDSSEE